MADYEIMLPDSISLFAAFCNGDHPDSVDPRDTWEPFAIFRRLHDDNDSDEIDTEIVGTMLRPWLNGVMATYESMRDDEHNLDVWVRMRDELWPKPPS